MVVICVSGIKDILEDSRRHKSDNQENNREVLIADQKSLQFKKSKWKDLKVGQIVKVRENQFFPADMVLLSSSTPKGICYVETKSLDGETNLKHKQSHNDISELFPNEADIITMQGKLVCGKPND